MVWDLWAGFFLYKNNVKAVEAYDSVQSEFCATTVATTYHRVASEVYYAARVPSNFQNFPWHPGIKSDKELGTVFIFPLVTASTPALLQCLCHSFIQRSCQASQLKWPLPLAV